MMERIVDYYLAPHSPWTWLGHARARAICAHRGARLRPRPVDLGRVFPATGGVALKDRPPARQAYRLVELGRWSRHLGVPLNLHPRHFPVVPHLAARTVIAASDLLGDEAALDVTGDLLEAVWVREQDIADEDTVAALLAARGHDSADLLTAAASDDVAARYADDTAAAIERGVFGSPTFVVDGELFWGQDRLEFVDRALA